MIDVFILAAGEHTRFGNVVKQLLNIEGMPLIVRTLEMLDHYECNKYVVTQSSNISSVCEGRATVINPTDRSCILSSLQSTKDYWKSDRIVVLLGDVIYSPYCLWKIFGCAVDYLFYGDKCEVFALAFGGKMGKHKVTRAISKTIGKMGTGEYGAKFWYMYQYMNNQNFDPNKRYAGGPFQLIEDYTNDIDGIDTYSRFLEAHEWAR